MIWREHSDVKYHSDLRINSFIGKVRWATQWCNFLWLWAQLWMLIWTAWLLVSQLPSVSISSGELLLLWIFGWQTKWSENPLVAWQFPAWTFVWILATPRKFLSQKLTEKKKFRRWILFLSCKGRNKVPHPGRGKERKQASETTLLSSYPIFTAGSRRANTGQHALKNVELMDLQ